MGNDGGSIPGRVDLVKLAKPENDVKRSSIVCCDVSKENLKPPIAICKLGYVFNKETILERMINKNLPEEFSHIKSMKDISTVNEASIVELSEKSQEQDSKYAIICPITLTEYHGNKR